MVGVLIVTHLDLAEALLNAANLIMGQLEKVIPVSLDPSAAPDEAHQRIEAALAQLNTSDGVIILTDMFGGTPSNLSLAYLKSEKIEVISGVNLPMLIKLGQLRQQNNTTLADLVAALKQSGQKGIMVASELLYQR